jgi:hypothetical protein
MIVRGNHQEDLYVDGRIFLKGILEKWDGGVWTGFILLRIGTEAGCCEHSNEPSDFIQFWEYLY